MSPIPSHIFVVRHGARLDMADTSWTASSSKPYDTPLTFAGWQQAHAVGRRVASLLHKDNNLSKPPPRIIIHTSPFRRCIQTSLSLATSLTSSLPTSTDKPTLRIDAWLAEWMNRGYYTEYAPPPASAVLVANAKREYMHSLAEDTELSTTPMFGIVTKTKEPVPPGMVAKAKENVVYDAAWENSILGEGGAELGEEWAAMHRRFRDGYRRLVWWYHDHPAISSARYARLALPAPKPRRSPSASQAPSTDTISEEEEKEDLPPTMSRRHGNPTPPLSDTEDDEPETVVILVTHSAGANALLGAFTQKPVLIDIAIASLTWAVLKSSPSSPILTTIGPPARKNDVPEPPVRYDVRLSANNEHLRPGFMSPIPGAAAPTPPMSPLLGPSALAVPRSSSKVTRSASHSGNTRPTGLWTPLTVGSPKLRAVVASPFQEVSVNGTDTGEKGERSVACTIVSPVTIPAVKEHSGAKIEGGKKSANGLWAARGTYERNSKRRWTVGREGTPAGFGGLIEAVEGGF